MRLQHFNNKEGAKEPPQILSLKHKKGGNAWDFSIETSQEIVNHLIERSLDKEMGDKIKIHSVEMDDDTRSRWFNASMTLPSHVGKVDFAIEMMLQKDGSFERGNFSFSQNLTELALNPLICDMIIRRIINFGYGYSIPSSWVKAFKGCKLDRTMGNTAPNQSAWADEVFGEDSETNVNSVCYTLPAKEDVDGNSFIGNKDEKVMWSDVDDVPIKVDNKELEGIEDENVLVSKIKDRKLPPFLFATKNKISIENEEGIKNVRDNARTFFGDDKVVIDHINTYLDRQMDNGYTLKGDQVFDPIIREIYVSSLTSIKEDKGKAYTKLKSYYASSNNPKIKEHYERTMGMMGKAIENDRNTENKENGTLTLF